MPKFLFDYHGGSMPQSPEEGERVMAQWTTWMDEVGERLLDAGDPLGKSHTVMTDGSVRHDGGSKPASGYSLVEADDIAAAEEIAKGCPILAAGGSVVIAEALPM